MSPRRNVSIAIVLAALCGSPKASADPVGEPPPRSGASNGVQYDLLTFYKENYIIAGFTDATEVKLQLSAKFDLWPNASKHAVHLAFTGKSLWDVYKPSAPFAETNYAPEVFYTFFHHEGRYSPPNGCAFFHERVGFEHESNGEAGARSRSWNRVYGESRLACYGDMGLFSTLSLKAWAPFGISENPGIVRHLGYAELGVSVGSEGRGNRWGDVDVGVLARKGTNRGLSEGSLELVARWRPAYGDFWRFTPYLIAQLFTGYGETLLSYDRSLTAFRVGIALSDTSVRSN